MLNTSEPDYPENSLIDEVLDENTDVIDAVRKNIGIIKRQADREIREIEIGYIAVHICAAIERKKNKEIAFHVIFCLPCRCWDITAFNRKFKKSTLIF